MSNRENRRREESGMDTHGYRSWRGLCEESGNAAIVELQDISSVMRSEKLPWESGDASSHEESWVEA